MRFFIYLFLYEGFGLLVMEVLQNQCTLLLLLSESSCFPKVAGNATAYFETESLVAVFQSLWTVLSMEFNRQR